MKKIGAIIFLSIISILILSMFLSDYYIFFDKLSTIMIYVIGLSLLLTFIYSIYNVIKNYKKIKK